MDLLNRPIKKISLQNAMESRSFCSIARPSARLQETWRSAKAAKPTRRLEQKAAFLSAEDAPQ
jgi:hypothetical protein